LLLGRKAIVSFFAVFGWSAPTGAADFSQLIRSVRGSARRTGIN